MKTIITRVGFCSSCYKAQRPRSGNFFVVKGKDWHIMKSGHIGNTGFVPFLYKLIKVVGDNVIYEKLCSLNDCGTEVFYIPSSDSYDFRLGKWERGMMDIKTWNALAKYKRDSDYFLEDG